MSKRTQHWFHLLLVFLLVLAVAVPAGARPWTTFGGTPDRQNVVDEPLGLLASGDYWRTLDFGQSASQPIFIGNKLYQLIGEGLVRVDLDQLQPGRDISGTPLGRTNKPDPAWLVGNRVRPTSSTLTYSELSGFVYWGTAWGMVYSYNTGSDEPPNFIPLIKGCSVVSSPLVLHLDGREVVVVGLKQITGQSDLNCTEVGKVYAIWGLDGVGDIGKTSFDIGGWATPSPIPDGTPDGFIMGADGGGVLKFQVAPTGDPAHPYTLKDQIWNSRCNGCGFAGSFTVFNSGGYWVDTAGVLRARKLSNGEPVFPDIPLAARVKDKNPGPPGTPIAFTNTSPAVDPKSGTLYVTLRNYWPTNDNNQLRHSSLTGSAGAIVAINATTGETVWAKTMPLTRSAYDAGLNDAGSRVTFPDPESLNTNPLVLPSLGAVIVADVNGNIHSLDMATGEPLRIFTWGDGAYSIWNMLPDGQKPERSQFNWSQISGAGTDPSAASGSMGENTGNAWLAAGANWLSNNEATAWQNGRLVLIPIGLSYNLRWTDGGKVTGPDAAGKYTFTGTVALEGTAMSLGQLRKSPAVTVDLFAIPKGWRGDPALAGTLKPLGSFPLPADLAPGGTVAVSIPFDLPAGTQPQEVAGFIDTALASRLQPGVVGAMAHQLIGDPAGPFTPATSTETTFADNVAYAGLPVNLRLSLQGPGAVACTPGQKVSVTLAFSNLSDRTIAKVPWELTARSSKRTFTAGKGAVSLPPGATSRTVSVPITDCGVDETLTATLNLPQPGVVAETDYSDNTATTVMSVDGHTPDNRGGGGSSVTVIVPADCQPNPDPSSRQPCLNYPDLVIPGW